MQELVAKIKKANGLYNEVLFLNKKIDSLKAKKNEVSAHIDDDLPKNPAHLSETNEVFKEGELRMALADKQTKGYENVKVWTGFLVLLTILVFSFIFYLLPGGRDSGFFAIFAIVFFPLVFTYGVGAIIGIVVTLANMGVVFFETYDKISLALYIPVVLVAFAIVFYLRYVCIKRYEYAEYTKAQLAELEASKKLDADNRAENARRDAKYQRDVEEKRAENRKKIAPELQKIDAEIAPINNSISKKLSEIRDLGFGDTEMDDDTAKTMLDIISKEKPTTMKEFNLLCQIESKKGRIKSIDRMAKIEAETHDLAMDLERRRHYAATSSINSRLNDIDRQRASDDHRIDKLNEDIERENERTNALMRRINK